MRIFDSEIGMNLNKMTFQFHFQIRCVEILNLDKESSFKFRE